MRVAPPAVCGVGCLVTAVSFWIPDGVEVDAVAVVEASVRPLVAEPALLHAGKIGTRASLAAAVHSLASVITS